MSTTLDNDLLRILVPRKGRLLCHKPKPISEDGPHKLQSGLYAPAQSESRRREFGMSAMVLKVHPDDLHGIAPGDEVIVGEFTGNPVYRHLETPYWIIGEGDVMATVNRDAE